MQGMLRNVRGSALIGAMAAVAVTGIAGVSAIAYNQSYLNQSHLNYVRAVMATVEANVRNMAMQPYAYDCNQGTLGQDQIGANSCTLRSIFFTGFQSLPMAGAKCKPPATSCGIKVIGPTFSVASGTGTLSARLEYEGQEVSIRPIDVSMVVPNDVLQAQEIRCPPDKPVFGGVNADGSPNCKSFPSCGAGAYVTGVDIPHRSLACVDLQPQSARLNCSGTNDQPMISTISWHDGTVDRSCSSVPTPPPATQVPQTIVSTPFQPNPGCPDTVYNDPQGRRAFGGQNGRMDWTTNFQSAVDQVAANCKYSSVTINFRRHGMIGSTCGYPGVYNNIPSGGSSSIGFINGGGGGNKTSYGTVVVNGASAYLTETTWGWGSAAGASTSPCIADVQVIVHSVPK